MSSRFMVVSAYFLLCVTTSVAVAQVSNGQFVTRVPITVPNGANGMQPSLSLNYNSGGGRSMLGVGWELSGLSAIARASYGDGVKYDGSDTYTGPSGRLVDVSGNASAYHGASADWVKYVPTGPGCNATCGDGPCCWTAYTNGGGKLYYGTTADSRIEKVGSSSVRVWALAKVEDAHGNFYDVTYNEDATNGDYYPAVVTYTKGNGLSTFRTVEFGYESRTDVTTTYADGKVIADQRLKSISVKSNGSLARKYEFGYTMSSATGRSIMTSLREYGSDGTSQLPEKTLYWTGGTTHFNAGNVDESFFSNANGWDAASSYGTISYADVTGDGRQDVCGRRNGVGGNAGIWCAVNNGTYFGGAGHWLNSYFRDADGFDQADKYETMVFLDVNNDSKADVCGRGSTGLYCALSSGNGFYAATQWSSVMTDANGLNQAQYYKTMSYADINGDDKVDLCLRGLYGVSCYANSGSGFSSTATVTDTNYSNANLWYQESWYSTVVYVDVNGDERADICGRKGGAGIWCAINNGSTFGTYTQWTGSGVFDGAWEDPSRWSTIRYTDINGDGRPDVCGRDAFSIKCYLNDGGRTI